MTSGDNDEELIGDELFDPGLYQTTTGGPRAKYMIKLGNDSMYYLAGANHPWGWFTASTDEDNCNNLMAEHHDLNGDSVAETQELERHCVQNGQHEVTVYRLTWTSDGSAEASREVAFTRYVAMLGYLGAFTESSQSTWFHDVRVTLDGTDDEVEYEGEILAGDYYMSRAFPESLYVARDTFTIAGGDTLWFMSTLVADGQDSRSWYNDPAAMLTQFNFDHVNQPSTYTGAVNSHLGTQTSVALWSFATRQGPYRVVGRAVAPFHLTMSSGDVRLADSLHVTAVGPVACFSKSGLQTVGALLTFNGGCSTSQGTREFKWNFGDNSGVDWSTDSIVVHHTYSTSGSRTVTLRVRRSGSTAPEDTTSQGVSITPVVSVSISGPDWITESGTYYWSSVPMDGAQPYSTYRWYYQQGEGEETLVGSQSQYSQYVSAQGSSYSFRLRHTVHDAVPNEAENELWVDVVPGGDRMESIGLLDASRTCRPLQGSRRARQAAHAVMLRGGRWPVPCLLPRQ